MSQLLSPAFSNHMADLAKEAGGGDERGMRELRQLPPPSLKGDATRQRQDHQIRIKAQTDQLRRKVRLHADKEGGRSLALVCGAWGHRMVTWGR